MTQDTANRRKLRWGAALALGVALGGCGGGGDSTSAPVQETATAAAVPDSALASPQAFMTFALSLKADDHAEPMQMNGKAAPTDDQGEAGPVGS